MNRIAFPASPEMRGADHNKPQKNHSRENMVNLPAAYEKTAAVLSIHVFGIGSGQVFLKKHEDLPKREYKTQ